MTPSYYSLNQGAAGTTAVAAAVTGKRHKVLGFIFSPISSGSRTWRFAGSVSGNLHGEVTIQSGGVAQWQPCATPFCETAIGEELRLVTTGSAFRGAILYHTEA